MTRAPLRVLTHAHHVEGLGNLALAVRLSHFLVAQPEGHIILDGHEGKEGIILEDRVDGAVIGGDSRDISPIDANLTRRWCLKPGDHAKCGRLAAPGGPQQAKKFTRRDIEVNTADRGHITVGLVQTQELKAAAVHRCTFLNRRNTLPPAT